MLFRSGARQRSHDTNEAGVVFHCERRARVFERDILRLGTAIGVSLPSSHCLRANLGGLAIEHRQYRDDVQDRY